MFFRKPKLKGPEITLSDLRKKRTFVDRRRDQGRREAYNLDYFQNGGLERRTRGRERRQQTEEQRKGWVRVSSWSSAYIGNLQAII